MDRPREAEPPWSFRRMRWVALAIVGILAFIALDRFWLRAGAGIELADFLIAEVRRGALSIEVQGAGALEPVSERWVTVAVEGTVEQVLARPGQKLARGDGIVRLANPQVRRRLGQARLALAEMRADDRRHAADVTNRRLAAEARLLEVRAGHDEQRLRLEAMEELRDQQAVSEVDFRSQEIRTGQAEAQAEFEARRFEELKVAMQAERDASETRLAARRAALNEAEAELDALAVASGVEGTLRELFVDPGAFVAAGGRVARVVDTSALTAVVRVPEFYASHLTPGQNAVASVLDRRIPGTVTRVDPAVTDGTVAIDVEFGEPLPPGARPDLSVRATVTVAELPDVLHVRRPLRVRDYTTADVFLLAQNEGLASRTAVRFGMGTLKDVEVLDGLSEGDRILLGSASRLEGVDVVTVR